MICCLPCHLSDRFASHRIGRMQRTEDQWTFSMLQQSQNRNFKEMLQRTTSAVCPDFNSVAITKAMDQHGFSWGMIRRESEENVVERLQSIDGLSHDQHHELYRLIKSNDPIVIEVAMRRNLCDAQWHLYESFIMRRMS